MKSVSYRQKTFRDSCPEKLRKRAVLKIPRRTFRMEIILISFASCMVATRRVNLPKFPKELVYRVSANSCVTINKQSFS